MKHSDYITHIGNKEDEVYLRNKHFPVNMRLFHSSPEYKALVLMHCDYIRKVCLTEKEGYKKPHGMSSANIGTAFNIIGITQNRGKSGEYCKILINPVITDYLGEKVETLSNCGSLTLEKPIKLRRFSDIKVEYYDEEGKFQTHYFRRKQGSLTIQHEVDHNIGILITDY